MTRHHQPTRRVNPKPSIMPQTLAPGKARCAGCSAVVSVTPNGRLRTHKSPSGEECAYRVVVAAEHVALAELPPVVLPPRPQPNKSVIAKRRVKDRPSASEVEQDARRAVRTGACVDCGKRLPGERIVCASCGIKRARARGRSYP